MHFIGSWQFVAEIKPACCLSDSSTTACLVKHVLNENWLSNFCLAPFLSYTKKSTLERLTDMSAYIRVTVCILYPRIRLLNRLTDFHENNHAVQRRPLAISFFVVSFNRAEHYWSAQVWGAERRPIYVGYSESKYCLRISLAHPGDRHFAHVQWLPLSIDKPQTPFREIRVRFMFDPVR